MGTPYRHRRISGNPPRTSPGDEIPIKLPSVRPGSLKLNVLKAHLKAHPRDIKKATVLAFVVSRGAIVSVGYNRKVFPEGGKWSTHAEEAALKKAGRRAVGATLHVIRIMKNGDYAYARPCHDCQMMIIRSGVAIVKYSDESWNT
jgi:deoxycytidylate deaminase